MTATGTVGDRRIAELRAPELVAAQARHHQIQQHQARDLRRAVAHGPEQMQRFEPILGRDGVKPFGGEQRREHLPRLGVVFDDQHVAGRPRRGWSAHGWAASNQVPYRLGPA